MSDEFDRYLEHARREMFPKMQGSAFTLTILGKPDPKLCLEIGAAIMFDKPILVVVPRGVAVPLALRTIAHKIVEIDGPDDEGSKQRIMAAVEEMAEMLRFRGGSPATEVR